MMHVRLLKAQTDVVKLRFRGGWVEFPENDVQIKKSLHNGLKRNCLLNSRVKHSSHSTHACKL